MPKRSNDFQRLVYLVRENLAEGAKVLESQLMRDRLTKRFREVDVVIKGRVGTQPVIVSIECRDHKRIADVTWVDTMKSKHERLETNVLLLASSSGFTKEAAAVAEKLGISTYTLETQDDAEISAKLGPTGSLWHKSFSTTAERVKVEVEGGGEPPETIVTNPDNLLYLHDETEFCQVREIVMEMMRSERMRDYLFENGGEEHKWFVLEWEPPADKNGHPFKMKKLKPEVFRTVKAIRVAGPCKVEIGKFRFQYGRLGAIHVAWSKAKIAGRDAMAVATVNEEGTTKLTVNFKGSVDG